MSTICAISTPAGTGGIAVIRISGSDAISITDSLFIGKRRLTDSHTHSVHYGTFAELDDVLATVFRAPNSFTGEDVVEISCHGSRYIQQEILNLLTRAGCRLAAPGEFTQRAFLNGKMDLTEAEAVADLIAAENRAAHKLALSHLRGGISNSLRSLRDRLLHFTSLIELELDFADHEELEFADRGELKSLADEIEGHISRLLSTFRMGNAIRNGIPVAITGPTNAGKSTLLNALAGEERAIVTDTHGTTRDTIEDIVNIGGVQFRFIDTAGIRQTDNEIEALGIKRSKEAARKAEIILLVTEAGKSADAYNLLEDIDLKDKTVIRVFNKTDLLSEIPQHTEDEVYISAKKGDIEELTELLKRKIPEEGGEGAMISNTRHADALRRALSAIQQVQKGLTEGISGEFLSMDLQDCLTALAEITGEITSEEVLGNIFSHFCIGK
ncbi:MAG: tRNA uridine-5-carboxymethylaminomethyl(34) synthesis GTPase MnmE [Paludibacteraceae bacterium]|nr:tRNA uridine-5-carboxymethylaminomethyl(34) synthesis GTPase MnmE [Paludibacteraceae bacterium]